MMGKISTRLLGSSFSSRDHHNIPKESGEGARRKSSAGRRRNKNCKEDRRPLEDSTCTSTSSQSLYDLEGENSIKIHSQAPPPVDHHHQPGTAFGHPSIDQPNPATNDTSNNCILLSLRWLYNHLLGSLNCFLFRPLIRMFYKKSSRNLNSRSSTHHHHDYGTSSNRERSPPFTLTVTDHSKQQLDIMNTHRAQMYPFSTSSRSHDFDLNDRRLSCESSSPNLVSFNFFPSSPFHSTVNSSQFNFEPKYMKNTSHHTFSHNIAKKYLNTQPLSCAHLSVGRSYKLQHRHPDNPFRESENQTSLTNNNLLHQKWSSEQMVSNDENRGPMNVDKRKRTLLVERQNGSYGFTLQTYGIQYQKDGEVELITYVDHVDLGGAAFRSGLLEGDVILAINGKSMEKADHSTLVNFIKSCDKSMRMVVQFEDCVNKVNLHTRFMKMKVLLSQKMAEYERVCQREKELLAKMNRGQSHTMKSVSSWTRLPHVQSIFPTVRLSPRKVNEDQISSIGGSFKSMESAVSLESKSTSEDSGFASNSSYRRSPITSHGKFTSSPSKNFNTDSKMSQSESCYELNPIPSSSSSIANEGHQESSLNQDKLFITRL